jgi:septal ring factor EnvC (AmiA/AmiB activator)
VTAQRKSSDSFDETPVKEEVLRLAVPPPLVHHGLPTDRDDQKISIFWRVFGGTLLSIVALLVVTAYQQVSGAIADLRGSISRIQEGQAEFVKKDDVNNRTTGLWTALREVNGQVPEMKTRTSQLEARLQAAEQDRKDLAEKVSRLTERLSRLEGQRSAPARTGAAPTSSVPPMKPAD